MPNATPWFPQEILDTVIDFLCEALEDETPHGRSIYTFTLVARCWVSRTRHWAFRNIALGGKWSVDVDVFIALLQHPLCSIRQHVRVLRLGSDSSGSPADGMLLIPHMNLLPNLQDLSLDGFSFTAYYWETGMLENVFCPTLERLDLRDCAFPRLEYLTEALSDCTALRHLQCSGLLVSYTRPTARGTGAVPKSSPNLPTPQHLTSLSLNVVEDAGQNILEWFSNAPVSPHITDVKLKGIPDEKVAAAARLLNALGPSVINLSLSLRHSPATFERLQHPFCSWADLSALRNLQNLTLAGFFSSIRSMALDVPAILARLSVKKVKSITLYLLDAQAPADTLNMPWEAIIGILNGPTFQQLECIVFQLSPMWDVQTRDATRNLLQETVGKQLLGGVKFVCRTESDWMPY
ncbi:hypothetical protein EXIGLDRAFT_336857 [Exidia glandulosa HHB12029]|uniref:F-box domain-containing protein n=1 Tax=Exidia glandulosa HHB12029 TaxID=1314781 RepID=A0A165CKQ2_EXIGL|nr:hypothetical protein EXIGLDRAFT_336857 [Exidia glandulosa HHB12029]